MSLFVRSLIPQQPYVVGRVAIQSASRGDRIIRYTMDNGMANRRIKETQGETYWRNVVSESSLSTQKRLS